MGNQSSKTGEKKGGVFPGVEEPLRKCFDRPIIILWDARGGAIAVLGSIKVYNEPGKQIGESSVMTFTFPAHNLVLLFRGFLPAEDAYLSSEASVVLPGLERAIEVYSLAAEESLRERAEDDRADLLKVATYKDRVAFACHIDAVKFLELLRNENCLGTSEKALSFTYDSLTLSDLRVQFFCTRYKEIILAPTCPSSDFMEVGRFFKLSASAVLKFSEHAETTTTSGDDARYICKIKDGDKIFRVDFRLKDRALKLQRLFETIQEERELLDETDIEPYFQFRAEGKDIFEFETVIEELENLKSASDETEVVMAKTLKYMQELAATNQSLAANLENATQEAQASTTKIASLATELDQVRQQELELTSRMRQMRTNHAAAILELREQIADLTQETQSFISEAATQEELLQKQDQQAATHTREFLLLQDEHERLQAEVDESQRTIAQLSSENQSLVNQAAIQEDLLQKQAQQATTHTRKLLFLQGERTRLQAEVDEGQRTIAELDQDIDALNDVIGRLTTVPQI